MNEGQIFELIGQGKRFIDLTEEANYRTEEPTRDDLVGKLIRVDHSRSFNYSLPQGSPNVYGQGPIRQNRLGSDEKVSDQVFQLPHPILQVHLWKGV